MSFGQPIAYTQAVEEISADEAETIAGLNQAFDTILTTTA